MPKCGIYVHLCLCMFARCWWICNAGRAKTLVINANGLICQMGFDFHFIYLPCRLMLKVNKVCELANLNFLTPSCAVMSTTPLPGRHPPSALHLLDWQIFTIQPTPPQTTQLLHCIDHRTHTILYQSMRLFQTPCRRFHHLSHAQRIPSSWLRGPLASAHNLALGAREAEPVGALMAVREHPVGKLQTEEHLSPDGPLANLFLKSSWR